MKPETSSFSPSPPLAARTNLLQRKCACGGSPGIDGECAECRSTRLQRQSSNYAKPETESPTVRETLNSPGQPLDEGTRAFMEPRFGFDFSQVRVHTDAQAAESARAVNALAYTVGQDIAFGAGQYAPERTEGRQLIAHELTHVVQQARGGVETAASSQHGGLEQEAEHAGSSLDTNGVRIEVTGSSAPGLARAPAPGSPGSGTAPQPRHHGMTDAEKILLNQVRQRLVGADEKLTAIVGLLIAEDGRQFEFRSGGGQGFSSHVEGKATAKMVELGITKATLLVEKEPCQICDRSVYPAAFEGGSPETPLISSRTGLPIDRQTPKINTAIPLGYELTVVDPDAAGIYQGVKSVSSMLKSQGPAKSGAPPSGGPSKPPAAGPGGGPAPASPVPEGSASPSKPRTSVGGGEPPTAAAPRSKGRATLSGRQIKSFSSGTAAWNLAGKIGQGASAGLTIWGAFSTIDDALAQIEKAKTGSVAPQLAAAIKALEATFPSAEAVREYVLWYPSAFETEENYPRAKDWLHWNGFEALTVKGDTLEKMHDELSTVLDYVGNQEKLEMEFKQQLEAIKPLGTELNKRTRVLYDIIQDVEGKIPYSQSTEAAASNWLVFRTPIHDVWRDLGRLESSVSYKQRQYEQAFREAQKERRAAAEIFNYWTPAFAKIKKQQTGLTVYPTSLPTD